MKQTLIVLIGLVVVPGLALAKVTVEPVTPQRLHKLYTGLLLQGDKLWATTQRSINDNNHRIEVYSQDGKRLLGSAVLPHMADSLAAFGPDVVIAVGRHQIDREKAIDHEAEKKKFAELEDTAEIFDPVTNPISEEALAAYYDELKSGSHSFYSVVRFVNGKIELKTAEFPISILAEFFAGTPERMYFQDVSDGVFSWVNGKETFLKGHVVAPGRMTLLGDSLYVLSRGTLNDPFDKNLVHFDLKTQVATKLFPEGTTVLGGLAVLEGGKRVVVTEAVAKKAHVFDASTNKLEQSIATQGLPEASAQYGRCLVVLTAKPRQLSFYDFKNGFRKIDQWDFDKLINVDFEAPRFAAVDESAGRIFVESSFFGNHSLSGIISVQNKGEKSPCVAN